MHYGILPSFYLKDTNEILHVQMKLRKGMICKLPI